MGSGQVSAADKVRVTITAKNQRRSLLSGKKYADLEIDYSQTPDADHLAGKHASHLSRQKTGYTTNQRHELVIIRELPITEFKTIKYGKKTGYYLVTVESAAVMFKAIGLHDMEETDTAHERHPEELGIWIPHKFHWKDWYNEMNNLTGKAKESYHPSQSTTKVKQEPPRATAGGRGDSKHRGHPRHRDGSRNRDDSRHRRVRK